MMERQDFKEKRSSSVLWLIFIGLAACILAGGYVAYHSYEQEYRKEVERQLSSVSELKVSQLVEWRKERLGDANVFYMNGIFSGLVKRYFKNQNDSEVKRSIRIWIRQISLAYAYNRIGLYDTAGIERLSFPDTAIHPESDFVIHDWEALKSGHVFFQDFYRNDNDQRVYLNIIVPILDEFDQSKILGFISMRIDPTVTLYPFIQNWPTPGKTSETLLIRREGDTALFLNELRFRKKTALNLRGSAGNVNLPALKAVQGQEGIVDGFDYRGVPVIADVRAVPGSPWFLVAKSDTAEVFAPLRERFWLMLMLVGALLSGAGASVGLIWRRQQNQFYQEQYRSAEALRESEARLLAILDATPFPIALVDIEDYNIDFWSRSALTLFGHTASTANEWYQIAYPDPYYRNEVIHRWTSILEKAKQSVQSVNTGEYRISCHDGSVRVCELYAAFLADRLIVTFNDITARKEAENEILKLNAELEQRVLLRTAQLDASNKELEAFSYSVSHDLRAPLRHVSGYVDLLTNRFQSELTEKGLHYLNSIADSVTRMGTLIDDLLHFSRTGRAELHESVFDMNRIVEEVSEQLRQDHPERNMEWIAARLPSVSGDPAMLHLVWMNLLDNAVKFTQKKKKARIETGFYEEKMELVFFVRDNGIGFDVNYAQKLFGVFQRLHAAEDFEGTGIGLANVYRIVSRHGGRTWAEAKPGKGATFYFTLPKKTGRGSLEQFKNNSDRRG